MATNYAVSDTSAKAHDAAPEGWSTLALDDSLWPVATSPNRGNWVAQLFAPPAGPGLYGGTLEGASVLYHPTNASPFYLRQVVTLTATQIELGRMWIGIDRYGTLYVNGQEVWSSDQDAFNYDNTYPLDIPGLDLRPYLVEGENLIAISVFAILSPWNAVWRFGLPNIGAIPVARTGHRFLRVGG